MTCCVKCGEPLIWDEDRGIHSDCVVWEPETEEDEKAVQALVFMIGLEEIGEIHEEAGDARLTQRTQEALEAVAVRYTELYTKEEL